MPLYKYKIPYRIPSFISRYSAGPEEKKRNRLSHTASSSSSSVPSVSHVGGSVQVVLTIWWLIAHMVSVINIQSSPSSPPHHCSNRPDKGSCQSVCREIQGLPMPGFISLTDHLEHRNGYHGYTVCVCVCVCVCEADGKYPSWRKLIDVSNNDGGKIPETKQHRYIMFTWRSGFYLLNQR